MKEWREEEMKQEKKGMNNLEDEEISYVIQFLTSKTILLRSDSFSLPLSLSVEDKGEERKRRRERRKNFWSLFFNIENVKMRIKSFWIQNEDRTFSKKF